MSQGALPERLKDAVPELAWLGQLRTQAQQRPLKPRVPLRCSQGVIGSVEPDFLSQIALPPNTHHHSVLQKIEHSGVTGELAAWQLAGDVSEGLALLALAMRERGLAGAWRDEALAVHTADGQRVGQIERGAVRPLGIATRAVHLVGFAEDGALWVQQRALTKANDPGLWDTLMGGMVSAQDTLEAALARETWEEAGLRVDQLRNLRHGGRVDTCRPSDDGDGTGYVLEQIDWYQAVLPEGLHPENQDGEVAQFAKLTPDEVLRWLQQGAFTLEASLILAQALSL